MQFKRFFVLRAFSQRQAIFCSFFFCRLDPYRLARHPTGINFVNCALFILVSFQYGRQNIENVRKQTHPNISRLDSTNEDDSIDTSLNVSSDHVDVSPSAAVAAAAAAVADLQLYHQKPADGGDSSGPKVRKRLDSRSKSKKQNGYSNGNFVISRDDALILLPEGGKHSSTAEAGFTLSRSARNSDTENSDVEVQSNSFGKHMLPNCQIVHNLYSCNLICFWFRRVGWSSSWLPFSTMPGLH